MIPKCVVIFTHGVSDSSEPFSSPYYKMAYLELLEQINKLGASVYFVSNMDAYDGAGKFSYAYQIMSTHPQVMFKKVQKIQATVVFDKSERGSCKIVDMPVVTSSEVKKITDDKAVVSTLFPAMQPQTIIVTKKDDILNSLHQITSKKVVIKSLYGSGGDQVHIIDRPSINELVDSTVLHYPLIVQEFIDSSGGITGLVEGVHDIRVKILGGKIIGGHLRWPQLVGELRSNVALGGAEEMLDTDELPGELIKMTNEIDDHFKQFPRYYSADFIYDGGRYRLLELNGSPGLDPSSLGYKTKTITKQLAVYLVSF